MMWCFAACKHTGSEDGHRHFTLEVGQNFNRVADPSDQKPKALLWSIVTCCTIYRCWDMAQLRWVLMFHHLLAAAGLDEASGSPGKRKS